MMNNVNSVFQLGGWLLFHMVHHWHRQFFQLKKSFRELKKKRFKEYQFLERLSPRDEIRLAAQLDERRNVPLGL